MTQDIKITRLKEFALSIFNNKEHKKDLEELLLRLNLNQEDIVKSYIDYDLDIFSFSNEIYDAPSIRMVMHIHNLLEGSWHIERQNIIYNFIKETKPSSIMDVGFGIPSLYIRKFINDENLKITLNDLSDSAQAFASKLLDQWGSNWNKHINFIIEDMAITSFRPPKNDIYLFQDSIEHVNDPTTCLSNFVKNSHPEAKFLLSLPIGPIIPAHHMAWDSDIEIRDWLKYCGLKIISEKKIKVNPEVDLFAEQVNFNFVNLIVLCEKIDLTSDDTLL